MKGKILAGRILVDPEKREEKTESGIIIPGNIDKRPTRGVVVLCGEGFDNVKMEVKVGDTVLFNEGNGMEVEIEEGSEKKYLLMEQRSVNYIV